MKARWCSLLFLLLMLGVFGYYAVVGYWLLHPEPDPAYRARYLAPPLATQSAGIPAQVAAAK